MFFFMLISLQLIGQDLALDSILYRGPFVVRCACMKKGIAVLDVQSAEEPEMVTRFVFDHKNSQAIREVNLKDTIALDFYTYYFKDSQFYFNRYLAFNEDSLQFLVYQPSYEDQITRMFFVDDFKPRFYISKKCSNKIIKREYWFSWILRRFGSLFS